MKPETSYEKPLLLECIGWPHNELASDWNQQVNAWRHVTEEFYFEMLECVPPRLMRRNAFMVGEAYTHQGINAVYCLCARVGPAFWARYVPLPDYDKALDGLVGV